ncbi:methyltransferase domain-containing protein [Desulfurobacterium sp.]
MKEIIAQNFSRGARNYEKFAIIQKTSAQNLLRFVNSVNYLNAVDIGAGAGELTAQIKNCIGVDISPEMCNQMKKKGIKCVCADAEHLPFPNESFELAVSNFAIQWMNLSRVFKEAARILKKNGYFILSVPVEGSLSELFTAWQKTSIKINGKPDKLFIFPSANAIVFYSTKNNFKIEFKSIAREKIVSRTASQALSYITKIGARNPYGFKSIGKKFYKNFCQHFFKEKEGGYPITYQILTLVLRKA